MDYVTVEHGAEIVVRTVIAGDGEPEGERWYTRTVRDLQIHWHVRDSFNHMIMQTGTVRLHRKIATVHRWISEPDEAGNSDVTPWITEGVLVGGREYVQLSDYSSGYREEAEAG